MGRLQFTKSGDFLADQLARNSGARRAGLLLQASLATLGDVTQQLDGLVQGAFDRLQTAMERKLADFTDANQRAALRLSYAGSLRMPADEQLGLLRAGQDSEMVTLAAAQQRHLPLQVQEFLVTECFDHRPAMAALAKHPQTDLRYLESLAGHPDMGVRLAVAANIGPRMRLEEPSVTDTKAAIYNRLLTCYEGDFAPFLVPVCRDGSQLEDMFAHTPRTTRNAKLFVENPLTPDRVLLDISADLALRLQPGGSAVAGIAKQQLEKRLYAESDAAPQPH